MFYKKVSNYRARRRSANQQHAKHGAKWRPILSLRALLAWKIGPAKFQCCITIFVELVHCYETHGHYFLLCKADNLMLNQVPFLFIYAFRQFWSKNVCYRDIFTKAQNAFYYAAMAEKNRFDLENCLHLSKYFSRNEK